VTHVVIGVGNAYRRDDGVGLAVAARLGGRVPAGVEVLGCELEPSRLIDAWQGADTALVVDAVRSGAEPGTLHRVDAGAGPVPASVFRSSSTHAFGVGEAVELARALGTLPGRLVLYGIEGAEFVAGEGLTAEVQAAVEPAAQAVLEELEQLRRDEEEPCTSER
jgi:hydrogenase maturation protease